MDKTHTTHVFMRALVKDVTTKVMENVDLYRTTIAHREEIADHIVHLCGSIVDELREQGWFEDVAK